MIERLRGTEVADPLAPDWRTRTCRQIAQAPSATLPWPEGTGDRSNRVRAAGSPSSVSPRCPRRRAVSEVGDRHDQRRVCPSLRSKSNCRSGEAEGAEIVPPPAPRAGRWDRVDRTVAPRRRGSRCSKPGGRPKRRWPRTWLRSPGRQRPRNFRRLRPSSVPETLRKRSRTPARRPRADAGCRDAGDLLEADGAATTQPTPVAWRAGTPRR